ncbi:MAG: hypothetical protein J5I50_00490 [Chitinophagaceae bacterium]|nr:hypothetical protein [Chitinophagaceae bacterium]
MKKYSKILLIAGTLSVVGFLAYADRGGFAKKSKAKMNIELRGSVKKSVSLSLKSGMQFRGSEIVNQKRIGNTIVSDAFVSYQKGNTVYLIPYKQKVVMPEYTTKDGYKLVIRPKAKVK